MKFFGFRGGVHPPENKVQTENMAVEELKAPKMIVCSTITTYRSTIRSTC